MRKTSFLDVVDKVNDIAKSSDFDVEANVGFVGPDGIKDSDGNKISGNKDKHNANQGEDVIGTLHEILEELAGHQHGHKEPHVSIDEVLSELQGKYHSSIKPIYDSINKTTTENKISGNLATIGYALTKITEAMIHELLERLNVDASKEMLQYIMTDDVFVDGLFERLCEFDKAETREEAVSSINNYLLALGEQSMHFLTTIAFYDRMVHKISELSEKDDDKNANN